MKFKMRKRYQRELNHRIRALNKNIIQDELWKGRFYFYQLRTNWDEFSDGSGGILIAVIRAYDKETGYYKDYVIDFAPWLHGFNWHLSMDIANKFITEDSNTWRAENRPSRETSVDYTGVKVDTNKLSKGQPNWYVSYEYFDGGIK